MQNQSISPVSRVGTASPLQAQPATASAAVRLAEPTSPDLVEAQATRIGAEVVDFRGYFDVREYVHGAVVFRAGDAADRVFMIKRGRVRLLRTGRNGRRAVLAILRPGDLFGEITPGAAMIAEQAVASGETEVWSIPGQDLRSLIESQPSLALEIIGAQAEQIRQLRRRLQGATFKEVPARLAETLLQLSETLGERCPHGGELDLRAVTQQDLADLVGASRSFVSTLVNEMKRDGSLGNVGRTVCIKDQQSLRRIASKEQ